MLCRTRSVLCTAGRTATCQQLTSTAELPKTMPQGMSPQGSHPLFLQCDVLLPAVNTPLLMIVILCYVSGAMHTHSYMLLLPLHPLIDTTVSTHVSAGAFRAILACTPQDLLPTVYLCTNRVAPAHAGIELGVGDATLIKVGGREEDKKAGR
jgi:hypothetical protein